MAHHGSNPLEGLTNEDLKKWKESFGDKPFTGNPVPNLGPTGKFPDGKLHESDEGEIMVGITSVEGRVILNFGKPIHWIGLTKEQAKDIAATLIKRAED